MDFTLSDEILAKKAAARRWVDEVLDPLSEPLGGGGAPAGRTGGGADGGASSSG